MQIETKNKIASFSLICAMLVVMVHCGAPVKTTGFAVTFHRYIAGGICEIANPFFFIVSGFFLGRHITERGWWVEALKKRIVTIVVPYLFFEFLYVTLMELWTPFSFTRLVGIIGLEPRCWPFLIPLWFLRSLIIFIVILPLFLWVGKWMKGKIGWISIVTGVFIVNFIVRTYMNSNTGLARILFYSVNLWGLGFFLFGVGLSRFEIRVSIPKSLSVLIFLLGVGLLPFRTGGVALMCILAGLWFLWPSVILPTWLKGVSFPLYLIHVFIITGFNAVLGLSYSDYSIPIAWMRWFVAISLSLIITHGVKRFSPKLARIIFGGRL